MTLWKFRVVIKDRETAIRSDGHVAKDGKPMAFLGPALDARRMADQLQQELVPKHPDGCVTVRPVQAEQVGPYALAELGKLETEREEWKMLARHLAWCMAEKQARQDMLLNPDIKAIAEQIIEVAKLQIAEELQQVAASKPGVIVDAGGRPMSRT